MYILVPMIVLIILIVLHIQLIILHYSLVKRFPSPPIVPIWGNLFYFRSKPEEIFSDALQLIKDYGKTVQFWPGFFRQTIVTTEPEIVKKVLHTSIRTFNSAYYGDLVSWLKDELDTWKNDENWYPHRQTLIPSLYSKIFEKQVNTFIDASNILIKTLSFHTYGPAFNIYPRIQLCILDIIIEKFMGAKLYAQKGYNSEYVDAVQTISKSIYMRLTSFIARPSFIYKYCTTHGYNFQRAFHVLRKITKEVIQTRRQDLAFDMPNSGGNSNYTTFLDDLLRATPEDTYVEEEIYKFIFGGLDTISSSISFTLYLLANHPEIQVKLFREIREVLGDTHSNATLDDLNEMKYLDLVIKESLRLYPPVPVVGRQVKESLFIEDNLEIVNNVDIGLFIYAMHRHPDHFTEPNAFIPERFLHDIDGNDFVYTPFGGGNMNCPGQKFAMLVIKSILAKILNNYELLSSGEDLKLALTLILNSTNGIPIKIRPR